jgi:hypothetical protein
VLIVNIWPVASTIIVPSGDGAQNDSPSSCDQPDQKRTIVHIPTSAIGSELTSLQRDSLVTAIVVSGESYDKATLNSFPNLILDDITATDGAANSVFLKVLSTEQEELLKMLQVANTKWYLAHQDGCVEPAIAEPEPTKVITLTQAAEEQMVVSFPADKVMSEWTAIWPEDQIIPAQQVDARIIIVSNSDEEDTIVASTLVDAIVLEALDEEGIPLAPPFDDKQDVATLRIALPTDDEDTLLATLEALNTVAELYIYRN